MKRICLLLSLVFSIYGQAQLSFRVVVGGADDIRLEGATVSTQWPSKVLQTDAEGNALLTAWPDKPLTMSVSHTGYLRFDTVVQSVISGTELYIRMTPLPPALQPVEVRGLRAGADAPFVQTNLNKAFIEKNNLGQEIPFLLNQTAGVVVNSDAGNGIGYTGIRIRGTDASRINMTINGIPYNDAESQGIFFVNLPDLLSSVSSIQVQRGVGTSSNGPGAFGATMNFSTFQYQPAPYAELNNSVGSFNSFKHTIKAGSGLINDRFTIDARVSQITSDGYIDRAESKLQSALLSAAWWGKKNSLRFNAILGREKTYQAWYGVSEADLAVNRTVNYAGTEKPGTPYENETDNYWQNHYQVLYNHSLPNQVQFNTAFYLTTGRGYFEQYKADQRLADYGLPPIDTGSGIVESTDLVRRLWLQNKLWGQTFSLQGQKNKGQWAMGGGWSYYPGRHFGEVIWTQAKADADTTWYDLEAQKTDANLYAKWQQKMGNQGFSLFGDLQYRYVHYQIEGFRNNPELVVNNTWNFFNPKAGIGYSRNGWKAFLSYAMANKEPNRDDFEAGVNQQPLHEQLHDVELQVSSKKMAGNLDASATLYYMHYKNQLVLTGKVNDVGAYARTNIPRSFRTGLELEVNWKPGKWQVQYTGAFSRNRLLDFTEFIDDYDNGGQQTIVHGNTDISFSPGVVQSLAIGYKLSPAIQLEWLAKHVGRQYLDNTANNARSLDAFINNDVRASFTLLRGGILKELKCVLQVNNLLNSLYEPNGYTFSYLLGGQVNTENFYYPMATRNITAALNLRF
jgi:iron complex outermembrane receptor protein